MRRPQGCTSTCTRGPLTDGPRSGLSRPSCRRRTGWWASRGYARHRQDRDARQGAGARGEERLPHDGSRALGLGRADAGCRVRHRERDPAGASLARNAGRCRGQADAQGRPATCAPRLREDGARWWTRGSLASTVQARATCSGSPTPPAHSPGSCWSATRSSSTPVDAGKPFAQLQQAGMQTAVMDEIMRQREPALKEAVEASIAGRYTNGPFEKLGSHVAEVKADNIAGAVAARWLKLSHEERENTGVMAPSHELRVAINGHIRERLAREGCDPRPPPFRASGWSAAATPRRRRRSPPTTRPATWWPFTAPTGGLAWTRERSAGWADVDRRSGDGGSGRQERRHRRLEARSNRGDVMAAARSTARSRSSCARATACAGTRNEQGPSGW